MCNMILFIILFVLLPKEEAYYCTRIEKLKSDVRNRFDDDDNDEVARFSDKLELIDALERLGLAYHFEDEIDGALSSILNIKHSTLLSNSLHSASLYFRLLREHGHVVPTDMFNGFKDGKGRFKAELCNDAKGMLSLYEASHLCFEGEEDMMHEAKAFTVNSLKLLNGNIGPMFINEAPHALELPLHWRMPRLENQWYIEECQRKRKIDTSLLEFAELDFNMVQATHQKDLTRMSRWWEDLGISNVLNFTRDRLVECFLWSIGLTYEPQYRCCREWLTKVVNLIVVIDDIYDIYGSIDELELFTDTVERWSIDQAIEKLPDYMKICFLALYNTTNEMVYTAMKENGCNNILPHLNKAWADFCKAMLIEAKWSKNGCSPSLDEYMTNAWISSSTPLVLTHAFFATKQGITNHSLEGLFDKESGLIRQSSIIFRLCNDLATSSAELERGDVPSAMQCYMNKTKLSELEAKANIRSLVMDMWGKVNKSVIKNASPFSPSFTKIVKNHIRTAHSIYQYGDGIGVQDSVAENRFMKLLVKKI
ncbi:hypothetical protein Sjap_003399 [Stephania japonica]|uniref:Uncharacterized protein n=1 Tax=Stephania japonica TaxID=461633 RepID=A0AAP0PVE6_9MAGN